MATITPVLGLTTPGAGDDAKSIHTYIQNTKAAINNRLALEHQNLDSGNTDDTSDLAQGRHIPGKVSAVLVDTLSNINAFTTGVHKGALAYGTDTNTLYIFNGTNWTTYSIVATNRVAMIAYGVSSSLSTARLVEFTESVDVGGYFSSSRFAPLVAGNYQVSFSLKTSVVNGDYYMYGYLRKNGSDFAWGNSVDLVSYTSFAVSNFSALVYLNGTTDYLEVWGTATTPVTIYTSSHFTAHLV